MINVFELTVFVAEVVALVIPWDTTDLKAKNGLLVISVMNAFSSTVPVVV